MFALWYLSLAVDEMRKRFGWTFFDIFYKTNKTDTNKALDNKPANVATIKKAEPKPTPPPPATKVNPTPAPTPAPVSKPVIPPKPVVEPPKPVVETPKPVAEPPKPVVEPPKPVVEPPKPAAPKPQAFATPLADIKPVVEDDNVEDALDRKFMEISKPKENGDSSRNNMKNATMDFLSGEANARAPSKR